LGEAQCHTFKIKTLNLGERCRRARQKKRNGSKKLCLLTHISSRIYSAFPSYYR